MLKKCMGDPSLIIQPKNYGNKDRLSYKEIQVHILDDQVCKMRTKEVASNKVLLRTKVAYLGFIQTLFDGKYYYLYMIKLFFK